MKTSRKIAEAICIFSSVILLFMVIESIRQSRDAYQIVTGIVCMFICLIPIVLKHKNIISLPIPLIILAEIAIFFHAYGVILGSYYVIPHYDIFAHILASTAIAICSFYSLLCVSHFNKSMKINPKIMYVYVFLIAMTFSVYWEVFEWGADVLTGSNMQHSPWDTFTDLLCDVAGITIVTIYAHFYMKMRDVESFIKKLKIHPRISKVISNDKNDT